MLQLSTSQLAFSFRRRHSPRRAVARDVALGCGFEQGLGSFREVSRLVAKARHER